MRPHLLYHRVPIDVELYSDIAELRFVSLFLCFIVIDSGRESFLRSRSCS